MLKTNFKISVAGRQNDSTEFTRIGACKRNIAILDNIALIEICIQAIVPFLSNIS